MTARRLFTVLLAAAIALAAVACGSNSERVPVESVLSHDQAAEMLENALDAFNTGMYEDWSRDWSKTLRSAISESAFHQFREAAITTTGEFRRIERVELRPGQSEAAVRWVARAEFENLSAELAFGMTPASTRVEGVFFNVVPQ